jgi:hypothetical protein
VRKGQILFLYSKPSRQVVKSKSGKGCIKSARDMNFVPNVPTFKEKFPKISGNTPGSADDGKGPGSAGG